VLTVNADVLAGRSLAAYCSSSATGGASRRIAVSCPCEASRAIAFSCRAKPRDILLLFLGCARSEAGLDSLRPSECSETLREICGAD